MRETFLRFGAPLIEQPEINEIVASLESGWLASGPKVEKFEEMFKKYKDTKHAIALNSGTAALHLSFLCLDMEKGDEVIVPTMTFAATANAVIHAGGRPVLADCNRSTMNITAEEIEKRITKKTRAIIPVHFAGRPCEMDEICELAERYNLRIIEDSAHAIEAEYKGRKAGTIGDLGCFSFHVTKNIITGEGGMVITENEEYSERLKRLRYHGIGVTEKVCGNSVQLSKRLVNEPGYKYTMMDLQAAIGIHQLSRIDEYWKRRAKVCESYNKAFADLPIILPADARDHIKHSYHLYILLLDIDRVKITREQFLSEMAKRNIGCGVHYIALHLHPFYQKTFGYRQGDFPNAEWVSERNVSIPLSAGLGDGDVGDVIDAISEIVERC